MDFTEQDASEIVLSFLVERGRSVALYCGKEAIANGRKNMNGNDRSDIAKACGFESWTELTAETKDEMMKAFSDGVRIERQYRQP